MADPCKEKAGFLFEHPCKQAATSACQRCAKRVCAKHLHPTPNGFMCTTCAKKEVTAAKKQGKQWSEWDDDPYLYDVYYYTGYGFYGRGYWGHDLLADDFTDADYGSTSHESDGDWEHDLGGS